MPGPERRDQLCQGRHAPSPARIPGHAPPPEFLHGHAPDVLSLVRSHAPRDQPTPLGIQTEPLATLGAHP